GRVLAVARAALEDLDADALPAEAARLPCARDEDVDLVAVDRAAGVLHDVDAVVGAGVVHADPGAERQDLRIGGDDALAGARAGGGLPLLRIRRRLEARRRAGEEDRRGDEEQEAGEGAHATTSAQSPPDGHHAPRRQRPFARKRPFASRLAVGNAAPRQIPSSLRASTVTGSVNDAGT